MKFGSGKILKEISILFLLLFSIASASVISNNDIYATNKKDCDDAGLTWVAGGSTGIPQGCYDSSGKITNSPGGTSLDNKNTCEASGKIWSEGGSGISRGCYDGKDGKPVTSTKSSYKINCTEIEENVPGGGSGGVNNKCVYTKDDKEVFSFSYYELIFQTNNNLETICREKSPENGKCAGDMKQARNQKRKLAADTAAAGDNRYFDNANESFSKAMKEAICENASSPENKTKCNESAEKSSKYDPTKNLDEKGSCAIDGIGWIICPVTTFLSSLIDEMYGKVMDPFLEIGSSSLASEDGGLKKGWSEIRNIVNILLIAAFLVVIMSQITGIGLSNYGLKKAIPKLLISAILINVSFYICIIAVDISNILGNSLNSMFSDLSVPSEASGGFAEGNLFSNIAVGVLAGGVGLYMALGPLLLAVVAGVISILVGLVCLVFRQAGVIILIALSPLAMLAMVLPNTEKYFQKWQKMFIGLLIVYPIIGLVMGASGWAGSLLRSTGTDTNSQLMQIAGALVCLLPAAAIPTLSKKSLDSLGSVGGTIQNKLSGIGAKATDKDSALGRYDNYKKGKRQRDSINAKTGNYKGKNPFRIMQQGAYNGKYGINKAANGNNYLGHNLAGNVAASSKIADEQIKNQEVLLNQEHGSNIDGLKAAYVKSTEKGDSVSANALSNLLIAKGGKGVSALSAAHSSLESSDLSSKAKDTFANSKGYMQKNFADIKKADAAFADSLKGPDRTVSGGYGASSTFSGLSDKAFANQEADTMANLSANMGGFTPEEQNQIAEKARNVLNNDKLTPELGEDQKEWLNNLASQGTSTGSNNPSATTPNAKSNSEMINKNNAELKIIHDDNTSDPVKEKLIEKTNTEAVKEIHSRINKDYDTQVEALKRGGASPQEIGVKRREQTDEINKYRL